jgi:hypothetical protein
MLGQLGALGLRYAVEGGQAPVRCRARSEAISRLGSARAIGHAPSRTSLENVLACAAAIQAREARFQRRYAP